jgi:hypothetical protein
MLTVEDSYPPADAISASMNGTRTFAPPPKTFHAFATATMSSSGITSSAYPPKPSPAHTSTPPLSGRHH